MASVFRQTVGSSSRASFAVYAVPGGSIFPASRCPRFSIFFATRGSALRRRRGNSRAGEEQRAAVVSHRRSRGIGEGRCANRDSHAAGIGVRRVGGLARRQSRGHRACLMSSKTRQRDRACLRRDPSEIHPWVEDLPDVPKARIAQRHIAKPQGCEAQLLGPPYKMLLVTHRGLISLKRFDGQKDAERQPPRRKHLSETKAIAHGGGSIGSQHGISWIAVPIPSGIRVGLALAKRLCVNQIRSGQAFSGNVGGERSGEKSVGPSTKSRRAVTEYSR
ncbi:MAG: hypothetical protein QOE70_1545 [Chthoniobacter sp.]|nr:hypothetical protein [Chthoniobacter sp.]